jgi:hypothetical protein
MSSDNAHAQQGHHHHHAHGGSHQASSLMTLEPVPTRGELCAGLSNRQLVDRYRVGVERFDRRVFELDDSELDTAFLPDAGVGRWPVRVLLGHLADAELAFVQRMRRVVAEENPILQPWDENAFIDSGMYGLGEKTGGNYPIGAFIAATHTLRQWTAQWLGTLNDQAFARKGLHTQNGEQSLRTILEYDTWHLEHHAFLLNKKIAKFRGALVKV